jgi:hypothetical protein
MLLDSMPGGLTLTRPAAWSQGNLFLKIFLAATFVCAIVLILGRLHSYYLDENERIAKGLRRSDR